MTNIKIRNKPAPVLNEISIARLAGISGNKTKNSAIAIMADVNSRGLRIVRFSECENDDIDYLWLKDWPGD